MNLETNNKNLEKGITLVIPNPCGNIKETKMKNSGVEWIGEIPDGWEVKKVKHSFVRKNEKAMQENPIVLSLARSGVRERDISNNEGQLAESYYNYNPVDVDDLLINPMDLYSGANCSISKVKGVISPAYINLRAKKNVSPVFYDYYFKVQYWMMAFFAHGNGVSFENRWTLNNETLQNYPIVAPSFETQQRIASYLDKKCNKIEETIQKQQQVIEKLKAYKQSLITEAVTGKVKIANGKICGEYESYKDSGVEYLGKIPSNWNVKRLRYIGKCQNGISKGGEFFGSGYPFVSYGDVYNNLVLPETVSGLIESTPEEQENYSVTAGDIFFTRTSETIEEVGFTSVCLKTIEKATFAGFVIRVRPFTEELVPDYSKYYFSSDAHRRFFVKEMNLVTRASLSQDLLKRLPVLIPSKEEQKEIANYLDKKCIAIDTAIEQKQNLIEKLTEYKKSLIYECVTGKKEI